MEQLFIWLYPLVAVASLAAYIPQIVRLIYASDADDKISLASWSTWVLTYGITLGYGIFHLKDPAFIITTALGWLAIVAVVGLVIYNRYIRFRPKAPATAAVTE